MNAKQDPTPAEIAERCAEIQQTWPPAERLKRLRADERPRVKAADGRLCDMTSDDLEAHHRRGDE